MIDFNIIDCLIIMLIFHKKIKIALKNYFLNGIFENNNN